MPQDLKKTFSKVLRVASRTASNHQNSFYIGLVVSVSQTVPLIQTKTSFCKTQHSTRPVALRHRHRHHQCASKPSRSSSRYKLGRSAYTDKRHLFHKMQHSTRTVASRHYHQPSRSSSHYKLGRSAYTDKGRLFFKTRHSTRTVPLLHAFVIVIGDTVKKIDK